jgi:predicted acylesterase/phospholipase RssA
MSTTPPRTLPDRWCDVVMEGGITSGIVYPRAIVRLASQYNFRNIGGTSAGAIAAAATAAAEYQRQTKGSYAGFDILEALPQELGTRHGGATKLFSLFAPQPSTAPLFHTLAAGLGKKKVARAAAAMLWEGLSRFQLTTVTVVLPIAAAVLSLAYLSGWPWSELLVGAVLTLLGALVGVVVGAACCLNHHVVTNGYGLCRGFSRGAENETQEEPLTLWLFRLIERCGGRDAAAPPLTFGDLWEARGAFPPPWLKDHVPADVHAIQLKMITTNVTNSRPFHIPLHDHDRLFFKPEELRDYFPANVVEHMVKKARAYEPTASDPGALPQGLLPFPSNEDLPIIVAARLSLSFPVLISAVPLWMIDYEPERGQREFRCCWFSDGGLTSNFPIHLFDSLLPLWPTFGIQLESMLTHRPDTPLFLPAYNTQGRADPWLRFDEKKDSWSRLGGFLVALFDAGRNWRDRTLAREPGVRDRVVRIRLEDDEGGLNLNMPAALVAKLGQHGLNAADRFLEHFIENAVPKDGRSHQMGFDNQRWMRLRTLLSVLRNQTESIRRPLRVRPPETKSWEQQLVEKAAAWEKLAQTDAGRQPDAFAALKDLYPLPPEAGPEVLRVFVALEQLADALAMVPSLRTADPPRVPTIRIVPDL